MAVISILHKVCRKFNIMPSTHWFFALTACDYCWQATWRGPQAHPWPAWGPVHSAWDLLLPRAAMLSNSTSSWLGRQTYSLLLALHTILPELLFQALPGLESDLLLLLQGQWRCCGACKGKWHQEAHLIKEQGEENKLVLYLLLGSLHLITSICLLLNHAQSSSPWVISR